MYAESRAGKVPGIRAKKRRAPDGPGHNFESTGSELSSVSSTELTTQNVDDMMHWPSDWHLESSASDTITAAIPAEAQSTCNPSDTTTRGNNLDRSFPENSIYTVPDILGQMNHLVMSPPLMNQAAANDIRAHPKDSTRTTKEVDLSCVQDSCHVIAYLEAYIGSGMSDFKIILGIIRQVLDKLNIMVISQQASRNSRCLMLFLNIMYQLLALVQVCLPGLAITKRHQQPGGLENLVSTSSGFGFGGFIFDGHEQALFHTQILLKEMREIMRIVVGLKILSGVGPNHGDANDIDTVMSKARVDCYVDLESRFQVIIDGLSNTA